MRNYGHARTPRIERPDSVTDPFERDFPCEVPFRRLDDSEKMTRGQQVILGVCILLSAFFGLMVAHGYYIWFLK
jgi:hypothetical protein